MVTASWNAPATAFTLPGEFSTNATWMRLPYSVSPDERLHRNDRAGKHLFSCVEENGDIRNDLKRYQESLQSIFVDEIIRKEMLWLRLLAGCPELVILV